jgi:outer membrane cobalamin receptor
MKSPAIILSLFLVTLTFQAFADVRIEGRLFEKGTRLPMKEVNVFILPHKLKATTDLEGQFAFESVPEGQFQFVVTASGYERLEKNDLADTEYTQIRSLFLEKTSYSVFETTIVGEKQKRDDSQKSMKQAQFLTLPGSGGDPVKAVQNLPGVNRVGGFSSQVVIQGSAPQDTKYDVDGHEIPIVFHFGGLTSVVMPEAIEQVDYLSAGYGPEYSRAMGGVISLKTRSPEVKDRPRKGFFFVDTLKSGALIEGKINDHSSYLVSGRYSYVGLFLKAATKDNESFNLSVAPEFSDLTVIYKNQLSETDTFKLDFLASRDTLGFVLREPIKDDPKIRGNFSNETNFVRFVPQWTHKVDEDRTWRSSLGIGRDYVSIDVGDNYFILQSYVLTARTEWEQRMNKNWLSQVGLDHQSNQNQVDLRLPYLQSSGGVSNPISTSTVKQISIRSSNHSPGIYLRNEYQIEETGVTLLPHLRADYFGINNQSVLSPRMGGRWRWSDSLLWKAATGLYYQPPQPQEVDSSYGNPEVKAPSAYHYTFGFEKDFRGGTDQGFQFSAGFFRRDFQNLVIASTGTVVRDGVTVAEVYNNKGGGRSQGLETQLKFDMTPWSGWISYTYSQSKRWDPAHTEYNFQYDQTHNFNLVTAYEAGRNWKYSSRFRYVTGNPFTPVTSATFDADNDTYIPTRGAIYSERQAPFMQVDIRIDKKWILNTEIWSLYLDIQNLLNAKNPEQIRYSYDYSQQEVVSGLPILPALGIKGEF